MKFKVHSVQKTPHMTEVGLMNENQHLGHITSGFNFHSNQPCAQSPDLIKIISDKQDFEGFSRSDARIIGDKVFTPGIKRGSTM